MRGRHQHLRTETPLVMRAPRAAHSLKLKPGTHGRNLIASVVVSEVVDIGCVGEVVLLDKWEYALHATKGYRRFRA